MGGGEWVQVNQGDKETAEREGKVVKRRRRKPRIRAGL